MTTTNHNHKMEGPMRRIDEEGIRYGEWFYRCETCGTEVAEDSIESLAWVGVENAAEAARIDSAAKVLRPRSDFTDDGAFAEYLRHFTREAR